ncbi:unnamed protein product [Amoebophrya sp. A120]|nr:unnamed protein product [Amoebophrya sp. A120]|eukprot:GSA120T00002733001.1
MFAQRYSGTRRESCRGSSRRGSCCLVSAGKSGKEFSLVRFLVVLHQLLLSQLTPIDAGSAPAPPGEVSPPSFEGAAAEASPSFVMEWNPRGRDAVANAPLYERLRGGYYAELPNMAGMQVRVLPGPVPNVVTDSMQMSCDTREQTLLHSRVGLRYAGRSQTGPEGARGRAIRLVCLLMRLPGEDEDGSESTTWDVIEFEMDRKGSTLYDQASNVYLDQKAADPERMRNDDYDNDGAKASGSGSQEDLEEEDPLARPRPRGPTSTTTGIVAPTAYGFRGQEVGEQQQKEAVDRVIAKKWSLGEKNPYFCSFGNADLVRANHVDDLSRINIRWICIGSERLIRKNTLGEINTREQCRVPHMTWYSGLARLRNMAPFTGLQVPPETGSERQRAYPGFAFTESLRISMRPVRMTTTGGEVIVDPREQGVADVDTFLSMEGKSGTSISATKELYDIVPTKLEAEDCTYVIRPGMCMPIKPWPETGVPVRCVEVPPEGLRDAGMVTVNGAVCTKVCNASDRCVAFEVLEPRHCCLFRNPVYSQDDAAGARVPAGFKAKAADAGGLSPSATSQRRCYFRRCGLVSAGSLPGAYALYYHELSGMMFVWISNLLQQRYGLGRRSRWYPLFKSHGIIGVKGYERELVWLQRNGGLFRMDWNDAVRRKTLLGKCGSSFFARHCFRTLAQERAGRGFVPDVVNNVPEIGRCCQQYLEANGGLLLTRATDIPVHTALDEQGLSSSANSGGSSSSGASAAAAASQESNLLGGSELERASAPGGVTCESVLQRVGPLWREMQEGVPLHLLKALFLSITEDAVTVLGAYLYMTQPQNMNNSPVGGSAVVPPAETTTTGGGASFGAPAIAAATREWKGPLDYGFFEHARRLMLSMKAYVVSDKPASSSEGSRDAQAFGDDSLTLRRMAATRVWPLLQQLLRGYLVLIILRAPAIWSPSEQDHWAFTQRVELVRCKGSGRFAAADGIYGRLKEHHVDEEGAPHYPSYDDLPWAAALLQKMKQDKRPGNPAEAYYRMDVERLSAEDLDAAALMTDEEAGAASAPGDGRNRPPSHSSSSFVEPDFGQRRGRRGRERDSTRPARVLFTPGQRWEIQMEKMTLRENTGAASTSRLEDIWNWRDIKCTTTSDGGASSAARTECREEEGGEAESTKPVHSSTFLHQLNTRTTQVRCHPLTGRGRVDAEQGARLDLLRERSDLLRHVMAVLKAGRWYIGRILRNSASSKRSTSRPKASRVDAAGAGGNQPVSSVQGKGVAADIDLNNLAQGSALRADMEQEAARRRYLEPLLHEEQTAVEEKERRLGELLGSEFARSFFGFDAPSVRELSAVAVRRYLTFVDCMQRELVASCQIEEESPPSVEYSSYSRNPGARGQPRARPLLVQDAIAPTGAAKGDPASGWLESEAHDRVQYASLDPFQARADFERLVAAEWASLGDAGDLLKHLPAQCYVEPGLSASPDDLRENFLKVRRKTSYGLVNRADRVNEAQETNFVLIRVRMQFQICPSWLAQDPVRRFWWFGSVPLLPEVQGVLSLALLGREMVPNGLVLLARYFRYLPLSEMYHRVAKLVQRDRKMYPKYGLPAVTGREEWVQEAGAVAVRLARLGKRLEDKGGLFLADELALQSAITLVDYNKVCTEAGAAGFPVTDESGNNYAAADPTATSGRTRYSSDTNVRDDAMNSAAASSPSQERRVPVEEGDADDLLAKCSTVYSEWIRTILGKNFPRIHNANLVPIPGTMDLQIVLQVQTRTQAMVTTMGWKEAFVRFADVLVSQPDADFQRGTVLSVEPSGERLAVSGSCDDGEEGGVLLVALPSFVAQGGRQEASKRIVRMRSPCVRSLHWEATGLLVEDLSGGLRSLTPPAENPTCGAASGDPSGDSPLSGRLDQTGICSAEPVRFPGVGRPLAEEEAEVNPGLRPYHRIWEQTATATFRCARDSKFTCISAGARVAQLYYRITHLNDVSFPSWGTVRIRVQVNDWAEMQCNVEKRVYCDRSGDAKNLCTRVEERAEMSFGDVYETGVDLDSKGRSFAWRGLRGGLMSRVDGRPSMRQLKVFWQVFSMLDACGMREVCTGGFGPECPMWMSRALTETTAHPQERDTVFVESPVQQCAHLADVRSTKVVDQLVVVPGDLLHISCYPRGGSPDESSGSTIVEIPEVDFVPVAGAGEDSKLAFMYEYQTSTTDKRTTSLKSSATLTLQGKTTTFAKAASDPNGLGFCEEQPPAFGARGQGNYNRGTSREGASTFVPRPRWSSYQPRDSAATEISNTGAVLAQKELSPASGGGFSARTKDDGGSVSSSSSQGQSRPSRLVFLRPSEQPAWREKQRPQDRMHLRVQCSVLDTSEQRAPLRRMLSQSLLTFLTMKDRCIRRPPAEEPPDLHRGPAIPYVQAADTGEYVPLSELLTGQGLGLKVAEDLIRADSTLLDSSGGSRERPEGGLLDSAGDDSGLPPFGGGLKSVSLLRHYRQQKTAAVRKSTLHGVFSFAFEQPLHEQLEPGQRYTLSCELGTLLRSTFSTRSAPSSENEDLRDTASDAYFFAFRRAQKDFLMPTPFFAKRPEFQVSKSSRRTGPAVAVLRAKSALSEDSDTFVNSVAGGKCLLRGVSHMHWLRVLSLLPEPTAWKDHDEILHEETFRGEDGVTYLADCYPVAPNGVTGSSVSVEVTFPADFGPLVCAAPPPFFLYAVLVSLFFWLTVRDTVKVFGKEQLHFLRSRVVAGLKLAVAASAMGAFIFLVFAVFLAAECTGVGVILSLILLVVGPGCTQVVFPELYRWFVLGRAVKRLAALRDSIDNVVQRKAIAELHASLVQRYFVLCSTNTLPMSVDADGNFQARLPAPRLSAAVVGSNSKNKAGGGQGQQQEQRPLEREGMLQLLEELESGFSLLKQAAAAESDRLKRLLQVAYDNYSQQVGWESLVRIPNYTWPGNPTAAQPDGPVWWQQDAEWIQMFHDRTNGAKTGFAARLSWYKAQAAWARAYFVTKLSEAVTNFSLANTPGKLQMSASFCQSSWNARFAREGGDVLEREPFNNDRSWTQTELSDNVKMISDTLFTSVAALGVGPPKDAARAGAKIEEILSEKDAEKFPDRDWCPERYMSDYLRARVVFATPAAVTGFFWYLLLYFPGLDVIRVKNKMKKRDMVTAADIHLNLRIPVPPFTGEKLYHIAELQLLLENFVLVRDLEHRYYEIKRANKFVELLAPVFPEERESASEGPG